MHWLILLSGVLNLILGITVWSKNPKHRLNYGFGVFGLSTAILIFLDFTFRFYPESIVLKSSYAFALLVPMTAMVWILEMCKIKFGWRKFVMPALGVLLFVLTYIDTYIVKEIHTLTTLGYKGELGPLFPIYSLYFFIYITMFVVWILGAHKKTHLLEKKLQLGLVLTGVLLYSLSAMLFSLILPKFFNIFDFTMLDAPSLIFFVGFTAYAILKHKLFDIKVIATELLTFAIWITMLIKIFLAESRTELGIEIGMFIAMIIFGILLIRGVLKEVKTREKMEKLAEQLERANIRLKKLDKAKSDFVTIASHQLRTPITAIKGYSSMLLEGSYGKFPPEAKIPLNRILVSSGRLVLRINEFLNLSRIERGKMAYSFNKADLAEMTKALVDEFSIVLKKDNKKKIKLGLDIEKKKDFNIEMDADKIRQVISNLIDNAIKYNGGQPKRKTNFVKVSLKQKNKSIVLKVTDSGIGINKEDLVSLFQKFTRANSLSSQHSDGSGLGLFVAKEIIKAHKGKIWAESPGLNKGSSFCLELPISR